MRYLAVLAGLVVLGCTSQTRVPEGAAPALGPESDSGSPDHPGEPPSESPPGTPPGDPASPAATDAGGERTDSSGIRPNPDASTPATDARSGGDSGGGSGREAGMSNQDAPLFNPMPCSGTAGSLLCDDFEGGMNPAYRPKSGNGSTIVVDETRARGGKKSLHARAQAAAGGAAEILIGSPVFPTANNSYFVRTFMYYASPPGTTNVHMFRVSGTFPGTTMGAYALIGGTGFPSGMPTAPGFKVQPSTVYLSNILSANHKGYSNPASSPVPFDRWACWELQVDGVNGEWRLWLDGVEQFTIKWNKDPNAAWRVPQVSQLSLGINHPHPEPNPIEIWFDDFVIGTQRVGCGS